jgi:hypothetical protein
MNLLQKRRTAMNHPIIASANGYERYDRMLKDAEAFRRGKAITNAKTKTYAFGKLWERLTALIPQTFGKSADSHA